MTSGNETAPSPDERQVFKVHKPEGRFPSPMTRKEKIVSGSVAAALLAIGLGLGAASGFHRRTQMRVLSPDQATFLEFNGVTDQLGGSCGSLCDDYAARAGAVLGAAGARMTASGLSATVGNLLPDEKERLRIASEVFLTKAAARAFISMSSLDASTPLAEVAPGKRVSDRLWALPRFNLLPVAERPYLELAKGGRNGGAQ